MPAEPIIKPLLEKIEDLIFDGADYLEVKRFLEKQNLDQEAVDLLLQKTDEYIVAYQLYQQKQTRSIIEMMIGGLLLILGLAMVLMLDLDVGFGRKVFAYGALVFGAFIFRIGYHRFKLPPEEYVDPGKNRGMFERH